MIKTMLLLLSCVMAAGLFAQRNPLKQYGTILITEAMAVKSTEVSVAEWMGFIVNQGYDSLLFPDSRALPEKTRLVFDDLRKTNDFKWLKLVKNSKADKKKFGDYSVKPLKSIKSLTSSDTNYFSLEIPVTGISFQQAWWFCRWKEALINAWQLPQVAVALPSVEVYQQLIPNTDSLNIKKCAQYNFTQCNCQSAVGRKAHQSQGLCLVQARSYWPTQTGLYNLQGNAAEMTDTKGIAMGGSFMHPARESFNDRQQTYSQPEPWLGFRYQITAR